VVLRNGIVNTLAMTLVAVAAIGPITAESVEKKWRVSIAAGGFNSLDEVESAAANEMFTLNDCVATLSCPDGVDLVIRAFRDPRDDSQVFGSLDINPATLGTASVQYGINKIFVIEGSIGYQVGDVGDIEVSAQLPGNAPIDNTIIPHNFVVKRVPVGELERVPIQISALARFRPRATFNPYFGAGLGYSIVGFETDPAFDQLSVDMDGSRGVQLTLQPFFATEGASGNTFTNPDNLPQVDLTGASIDASDTFEWHLVGGAEVTFKRRWSAFLDLRWVDSSRSLSVGFNGSDELGSSLPNFAPLNSSAIANATYGPNAVGFCSKSPTGALDQNGNPVTCSGGGLVDFGRLEVVPSDDALPGQTCTDVDDITSSNCVLDFVFEPDGVPDAGQYYAQGGSVDYDGFSLQIGIRFTFGN